MEIIKEPHKLTQKIKELRRRGNTIGFVPTMGFLHDGHISLIKEARKETGVVVLSIFVNPTQFAPGEDYNRYPRALEWDRKISEKEEVDIIFAPAPEDMYPEGYSTYVEETHLSRILEGESRPSHFRGVTTVVLKLFNIIQPDISYFGQKDWQQAIIVKRMVRDLNIDTEIKILPTIREKDGLALSSRNTYLKGEERNSATILFHSLMEAKRLIEEGEIEPAEVSRRMEEMIQKEKFAKVDYIQIREPETLETVEKIKGRVIILLAVWIGKVRLIDNMIIEA
ncbi:MAG TPA: pantoate--beta-alanine ligase [Candidatus Omnitrophica bacterium]|nr:pantoate--beta-alanine ligase [Candidatus Omnitrophota bacterium]